MLIQNMFSLIIGLNMKDYFFNKYIGISGNFDIYLVSPFTSYFDIAFDFNIGILTKILKYKSMTSYIKTEIISYFLFFNGKMENNLKIQTSLGFKINEK